MTRHSRKAPVIAAVIALILGPFFGMCYAGRGQLALGYLALECMAMLAGLYDIHYLPEVLHVLGALHCYALVHASGKRRPQRWFSGWKALTAMLVVPLVLAVGFRTFLYQPFSVQSVSMNPALHVGDYVVAEKFAYRSHPPARGDVIVFRSAGTLKDIAIKRVIGLPGETVQLRQGIVLVNGQPTVQRRIEDYMSYYSLNGEIKKHPVLQFSEVLPGGRNYRVIVDTFDSPAQNTEVFTLPEGYYFVLGDNRGLSLDSRDVQKIGFVPAANIIGKATRVLWNKHTRSFSFKAVE